MSEQLEQLQDKLIRLGDLERGDIVEHGGKYYVFHGFDLNAYQFYGEFGTYYRILGGLDIPSGLTYVGHVSPGRGVRKRFAEFLKDLRSKGKA